MSDPTHPHPRRLRRRLRNRLLSGTAVLIPLAVTILVFRFLLGVLADVLPEVGQTDWPWMARAALSLGILLGLAYVVGEVAAHVVGQRVIAVAEGALLRVPFVKVIYSASKQVMEAFRLRRGAAFREVVLVDFPRLGTRCFGFVTNTLKDGEGRAWHVVFIPTTPNPTTGFMEILPADETVSAGITVEDAIKSIMSLGVLTPQGIGPLLSLPTGEESPMRGETE